MTDEIKPVAYMTEHEQGPMVWLNEGEALSYTDDDSPPIPLVRADQVRAAVLEAKAQERERCAKLCDAERDEYLPAAAQNNGRSSDFAFGSVNSAERIAAAIRSGHSITETQRAEE